MELPVIRKVQNLVHQVDDHKKTFYIRKTKSILGNIFYYVLLLSLSFVFLYPLLYMISQSLMRPQDVADATIQWIPKVFALDNYIEAFKSINYWHGLLNSIWISFGSAVLQIISCSFIGYGFARYKFPGKGLWLALLIFTFLVPPQTIVVPL
jgi:multiple sugar transport system permease protein